MLQWVHGLITVVMRDDDDKTSSRGLLQWVHGLITVVMMTLKNASRNTKELQWVHGLITVVMMVAIDRDLRHRHSFNGSTV